MEEERAEELKEDLGGLREDLEILTTDKLKRAHEILQRAADQLGEWGIQYAFCALDLVPIEGTKELEVKLVQASTISTEQVLDIAVKAIELNGLDAIKAARREKSD